MDTFSIVKIQEITKQTIVVMTLRCLFVTSPFPSEWRKQFRYDRTQSNKSGVKTVFEHKKSRFTALTTNLPSEITQSETFLQ